MRDALQVLEEYHARAVATGNEWAQTLARKATYEMVPGEPSGRAGPMVERLREWIPRVGDECLLQGWNAAAQRVTVLELDGGFARLLADGDPVPFWNLVTFLNPLVRP